MIALLDALPLFGAGVALIPWALAELLLSNPGRAAGLALLFAVILVFSMLQLRITRTKEAEKHA